MRVNPSANNLTQNLTQEDYPGIILAIVCNKEYKIVEFQINENFGEIHILKENISEGKTITELIRAEELNDFLFYSSKALKGESISVSTYLPFNGSKKVNLRYEPFTENHFIKGFVFIVQDIQVNPLKKIATPAFLNDSDLKFQTIFEQASIAVMIYGLETEKLIVNQKFCDMLGYSQEEISERDFWEFTHREDKEESKRSFTALLKGEIENYIIHKRYLHKNGTTVWIQGNCSLILDHERKPKYVLSVVQDITSRKEIELNLKDKEATFRSMFHNAPVGMVQVDLNRKWISVNEKFCEIIGYTIDEIKYLNTKIITYPDDYLSDLISKDKLIRGLESTYTREKRYIHKKGNIVWVSVTVTIFRDALENPLYFISIVQDISAKKRAEQELMFKNNELDTFLYRASHDLKGPVASLLGICNLVQFEVKDKSALNYFNWVKDRAVRMHTIITSLAEIGRIKDLDPEIELIDFDQLFEKIFSGLSDLPNYSKITKKVDNSFSSKFYSDKNLLSIIFHNLLENSINYADLKERAFINISIENMESGVRIIVSDNGIGIPEEFEDKIYNMFFRGAEQSTGSGLGLYIAKNAVDKLNGTITLVNRNVGYTAFSLYIPNSSEQYSY